MPQIALEKPIYIQLIIDELSVAQALEKGKRRTGIKQTTTYLTHLIVTADAKYQ